MTAKPIVTDAQIHRVQRHLRERGEVPLSRHVIGSIAVGEPQPRLSQSHETAVRIAAAALCVPAKFEP